MAFEWLAFLLLILEVPSLNLGLKTVCAEQGFIVILFSRFSQLSGWHLKIGRDRKLPYILQFVIYYLSLTSFYVRASSGQLILLNK